VVFFYSFIKGYFVTGGSKNGRLLSAGPLPYFPLPQLPFKTDVIVEGFWRILT
jgi:hypothetical protein